MLLVLFLLVVVGQLSRRSYLSMVFWLVLGEAAIASCHRQFAICGCYCFIIVVCFVLFNRVSVWGHCDMLLFVLMLVIIVVIWRKEGSWNWEQHQRQKPPRKQNNKRKRRRRRTSELNKRQSSKSNKIRGIIFWMYALRLTRSFAPQCLSGPTARHPGRAIGYRLYPIPLKFSVKARYSTIPPKSPYCNQRGVFATHAALRQGRPRDSVIYCSQWLPRRINSRNTSVRESQSRNYRKQLENNKVRFGNHFVCNGSHQEIVAWDCIH